jgi:hypothetical protein
MFGIRVRFSDTVTFYNSMRVITHGLQLSERVISQGPLQIEGDADIFPNLVRGIDIFKGMNFKMVNKRFEIKTSVDKQL